MKESKRRRKRRRPRSSCGCAVVPAKGRHRSLLGRLFDHHRRLWLEMERCDALLENQRAEYEALRADWPVWFARATKLFAERRFARWRYTAADIQRAFLAVGVPEPEDGDVAACRIMHQAMLFLGRQRCPNGMSLHLKALVPVYVKAGRFMDAWLLRDCAHQVWKQPDEINPFLYEMFLRGLGKWTEREDRVRNRSWRKCIAKGKPFDRLTFKDFGLSKN